MSLKKFGLALLAVLALSAVAANSAMALASTGTTSWYAGGVKATKALTVGCSQNGELHIETTIAETHVKLRTEGTACEAAIENATNEGAMALFSGKITFRRVVVNEPAGCLVNETLTSKALSGQLFMDGEHSDLRIAPSAGENTQFAVIEFEGGPPCPLNGESIVLKGSVFGQEENFTGESAFEQRLNFSAAINEGAGGTFHNGPNFASKPAVIIGNIGIRLVSGESLKSE